METEIFSKIAEIVRLRIPSVLCIVCETKGSVPRKVGAKMLVCNDGTIYGTIGGGKIEKEIVDIIPDVLREQKAILKHFVLSEDLNMSCGGSLTIYMEPLLQLPHLIVFGCGHVGKAVVQLALSLDFQITVVDPRRELLNSIDDKKVNKVCDDYLKAIPCLEFDDNTYIVIVTPQHQSDEDILAAVARKPHAYLGLMGSKNKVRVLKERFIKESILTAEELDKVDMPIGIKFAAETPAELAVSIMAKIIDVRNSRKNQ